MSSYRSTLVRNPCGAVANCSQKRVFLAKLPEGVPKETARKALAKSQTNVWLYRGVNFFSLFDDFSGGDDFALANL